MRTVTVLDVTTEAIIYKSLTLSNYQQYSEAKRTSENKGLEEMQASTREGNVGQSQGHLTTIFGKISVRKTI